ncbi:hypothetical protein J2I47_14825 [Fibrella sp. HMF5335]|uniref:ABC transporter ATPase n=1 Tax=Fibrella rubiginis TaxID=2817060 RepID=A0A939GGC3_9BACT|nr:hypothetical protein [Fibrella rubiginis]MBO0937831.1 hypothetical protein [Fibrella rubiginis]
MYLPFDQMPASARLWVYQANRPLAADDVAAIDAAIRPALDTWAAHGHPLLASANVVDGRFLLLAVDEGAGLPSGCSIDSSVHTVQAIGQALQVDFLDCAVVYRAADGSVQTLPLGDVKAAVAEGLLTPETLVFNTLIKTIADFHTNWQLPAASTWLKRYFKNVSV